MAKCREAGLDDRNQVGHCFIACGRELDPIPQDCPSAASWLSKGVRQDAGGGSSRWTPVMNERLQGSRRSGADEFVAAMTSGSTIMAEFVGPVGLHETASEALW